LYQKPKRERERERRERENLREREGEKTRNKLKRAYWCFKTILVRTHVCEIVDINFLEGLFGHENGSSGHAHELELTESSIC